MSAPPVLTELKLSEDMKQAVNTAFERLKPVVISYVDENHAPQLSFRGSTQAYSDTAPARSGSGTRTVEYSMRSAAIRRWPSSTAASSRRLAISMIFRGKARIDTSEAARRRMYESARASV